MQNDAKTIAVLSGEHKDNRPVTHSKKVTRECGHDKILAIRILNRFSHTKG